MPRVPRYEFELTIPGEDPEQPRSHAAGNQKHISKQENDERV